ncbi:lipocalin family protein [Salinisphaera sp. T31B1]|uniref:lipocalin family protein n=1 Tax=Salinisphaera sp. T31B1 TaxID=727963 RepID=UPI003340FE49
MVGCAGLPKGTSAVQGFELDRYLGRWYEIARLDHGFERGLDCVSASYSRRDDGGVRVINRGVNLASGEISQAEGKAYFVDDPQTGRFKVSFFGPFYGGYNILALDEDYRHVLIAGSDRDYLWILARTPMIDETTHTRLVARARALAFPVDELIDVVQGSACQPYRMETATAERASGGG